MYTAFYGLREKPFALTPDPRFLFLAESHREALAHLLYGIEQGEGFIAITGEVGTGKTTLCRALLGRLGPEVEVAFLFNPQLTARELIEAIHAELGIESRGGSFRELMAQLNLFLLERQREGRRVLLIVDEAQGLAPETLEQTRLLSNLETESQKLIQILLLAQPELDTMLASSSLRQLRQRIGVRWRLRPLRPRETRAYVRHRLHIAGAREGKLFKEAALRQIHRRSRGIPRLINLLCDRALLAGYAAGAPRITPRLVRRAHRDLSHGEAGVPWRRRPLAWFAGCMAALLLAAVAWGLIGATLPAPGVLAGLDLAGVRPWRPLGAGPAERQAEEKAPDARLQPEPAPAFDTHGESSHDASFGNVSLETGGVEAPGAGDPVPPPTPLSPLVTDPAAALALRPPGVNMAAALEAILGAWKLPIHPPPSGILSFSQLLVQLGERGLSVLALQRSDLATLRALGHPALLAVDAADGVPRIVALRSLSEERALVGGIDPQRLVWVPLPELVKRWGGDAYVVWQDFEDLPQILRLGAAGQSVAWLQYSLRELGFYSEALNARFDSSTREAVRAFQHQHQLEPDGEVGPLTKMGLYAALPRYSLPRLSPLEELG